MTNSQISGTVIALSEMGTGTVGSSWVCQRRQPTPFSQGDARVSSKLHSLLPSILSAEAALCQTLWSKDFFRTNKVRTINVFKMCNITIHIYIWIYLQTVHIKNIKFSKSWILITVSVNIIFFINVFLKSANITEGNTHHRDFTKATLHLFINSRWNAHTASSFSLTLHLPSTHPSLSLSPSAVPQLTKLLQRRDTIFFVMVVGNGCLLVFHFLRCNGSLWQWREVHVHKDVLEGFVR